MDRVVSGLDEGRLRYYVWCKMKRDYRFIPSGIVNFKATMVFALVVLAILGCGKKANPKPPEESAPAQVRNLNVIVEEAAIVLTWDAPESDSLGDPLSDLGKLLVNRAEVEKGERGAVETIAEIDPPLAVLDRLKADSREGGIRGGSEPAAGATEPQFSFRDEKVVAGGKYDYVIVPTDSAGVLGLPSKTIRVTFIGKTSIVESF